MDLICFSHLRWDFVFQRPQHILSRLTANYRVFYIEEPFFNQQKDQCEVTLTKENVYRVIPLLSGEPGADTHERVSALLEQLFSQFCINNYLFWYYTPMALPFTRQFHPKLTVFDSMDELSAFKFAPPELLNLEEELFKKADLVFTGGFSLYEAKKHRHENIHCFPSSIEKAHFSKARTGLQDPADQQGIPHPRIGFYGVLDERFDIELIRAVADLKPEWQLVLIGPVVKIDPTTLPRNANIHYLGGKTYDELPAYISGWDIAMIAFALNDSTRFISPTKTPEYLAAGKPVISTAIKDVVHPYGTRKLVHIINSPEEFIEAAQVELEKTDRGNWLAEVDAFLANNSWDETVARMQQHILNTGTTFTDIKQNKTSWQNHLQQQKKRPLKKQLEKRPRRKRPLKKVTNHVL